MTSLRVSLALALALLVALPLAWPLGELSPGGLRLDPRLAVLARNTAWLLAATLAVSLPAGIALAVLLERADLPGRRALVVLVILALFVPLPLFVAGWQVAWPGFLGGVWSAALLHGLVAVPWVMLIVGLGLRSVEPELEDDALLERPPAWVLWHVTLRRSLPAVMAAALWVVAQASSEVTITDLAQVRTFAEEVYTQLVAPESDEPVGRAVAVALVGVAAMVGAVLALARHAERLSPPGDVSFRRRPLWRPGVWRWPLAAVVGAVVLALVALPCGSLVFRAGLTPAGWSVDSLAGRLVRAARFDAWLIGRSLAVCAASGLAAATAALVACWLARGARWFGLPLLVLMAAAWAMPGPVVGLGLKGLFEAILDLTDGVWRWPRVLLWDGPSVAPLLAVNFVRFLPFASALVWPAVHRLPGELFDLARLDGVSPWGEFRRVVWPLTRRAWARAALAVATLSLGELSAGKLVSTPQAESFAESVWAQMHYGVTADLAARCLLLLGLAAAGAAALLLITRGGERGA
jgi:iron(III) transport system permease protein